MKQICIIAPMQNSLEKVDLAIKELSNICKNKYDFLLCVLHCEELPKNYNKKKKAMFLRVDENSTFDDCIKVGMQNCNADAVIIADVDDKNVFKKTELAIKKWENGADIVLQKRKRHTKNIFSRISNWLYSKMLEYAKLESDNYSYNSFGLFSKEYVDIINEFPEKNYYMRHFNCFVDCKVEYLDYEKLKKSKSFKNIFNQYFIMYVLSFLLAITSLLMTTLLVKHVASNNQAIFSIIGVTLIFFGTCFGLYNFHKWFLQIKTKLPL